MSPEASPDLQPQGTKRERGGGKGGLVGRPSQYSLASHRTRVDSSRLWRSYRHLRTTKEFAHFLLFLTVLLLAATVFYIGRPSVAGRPKSTKQAALSFHVQIKQLRVRALSPPVVACRDRPPCTRTLCLHGHFSLFLCEQDLG